MFDGDWTGGTGDVDYSLDRVILIVTSCTKLLLYNRVHKNKQKRNFREKVDKNTRKTRK